MIHIYKYSHNCGVKDFLQALSIDKDSIVLKCVGCGGQVAARQIRDKSAQFATKNGVTGVIKNVRSS